MITREPSSFKEYAEGKGINISGEKLEDNKHPWKLSTKEASEKLEIIAEIQKAFKGYSGAVGKRLPNSIGALIESSKVQIKRLKRDLVNLEKYSPLNEFEELIKAVGEKYLERAENSLKEARGPYYIDCIYRSMRDNEISLGNVNPDNVYRREKLIIRDIESCSYNLVECDAISFLSKAKRRKISLNYIELIDSFCLWHDLESESRVFIRAMVNYPYEFMRACSRYRNIKKDWTADEYLENLKEAIRKDGEVI